MDPHATSVARIRKLDESVVNRIAAGEIIIHPANAIKEMLENSIDAGSTMVDVLIKDGGLKLLQVADNGDGIAREDLKLLCERFATSKIVKFDDLSLIETYGFRGEAMASISHIGRLSVVTKSRNSPLAYKAYYVAGKLANSHFKVAGSCEPKPQAGKDGTVISVEDLFYNFPSRLRTIRSKSDEWAKILDVVGRYAVHTDGVGFSCKKFGESFAAITTRPQASLKERIRTIFGTQVASELIEFRFEGEDYGVSELRGAVSGFNYNNKRKTAPVFFINNRLVSCDPLRRAMSSVFQVFLPKGNHPFVYLSLRIAPQNLDVNVHPTKKEVRFLHEDEIIEWVCGHIHEVLANKDNARTFKQSTLKRDNEQAVDEVVTNVKKYRQENKLVRVDVKQPKISAFARKDFQSILKGAAMKEEVEEERDNDTERNNKEKNDTENDIMEDNDMEDNTDKRKAQIENDESIDVYMDIDDNPETSKHGSPSQPINSVIKSMTITNRDHTDINLDSITELRQSIKDGTDRSLTNVFNNLVYVGIVDPRKRLCCFQYDVKLFLCDYGAVLSHFYYQLGLIHFANFGEYTVDPMPLRQLLEPLYDAHPNLEDIERVVKNIMSMEAMFLDYFQLDFSNESLCQLPLLLSNVTPSAAKLPYFIYRLGTKVNYTDEKQCLHDILHQIALLYIPDRVADDVDGDVSRDHINYILESFVFPGIRKHFLAPKTLALEVVQVADLPGLYRVFERC
ncbi:CIC11C00000001224 [Sungouiella intermedia]|uniref:CIC11C00000001224 n=1 Tax=Sungouiella intermedia TaxID=45354 RepID=A0A1L0FZM1_9ASCO|nr:CIC11C00000001224 [[Candida] intermedia]